MTTEWLSSGMAKGSPSGNIEELTHQRGTNEPITGERDVVGLSDEVSKCILYNEEGTDF